MLGQDFKVKAPNKVWCSDITYIRTDQGWLYLATVIDLYSRMIIGWSMSTSLKTKIVDDALLMALWKCKPDKSCITQIVVHNIVAITIKIGLNNMV
ncbi:DDE-type integrase/transposase/recombinase [Thiotrichales bacterium 19S11-10]|nr:DDE-type integrase/transposase/recombinase [Thiotrichales bacterium 19S11-10]